MARALIPAVTVAFLAVLVFIGVMSTRRRAVRRTQLAAQTTLLRQIETIARDGAGVDPTADLILHTITTHRQKDLT